MHASLAAAVASPRFDRLMIKLGFDCEPFSAMVEYSEYKYETAQASND